MQLPSVLALSSPRAVSWAAEAVPGPLLRELTLWDELGARSRSHEHCESSQMVERSRWSGKAEAKAKFCSFPSCFSAAQHLPPGLSMSPSPTSLYTMPWEPGALCYVAGRLHAACLRCEPLQEPFVVCPLWPVPCSWSKLSFQFICMECSQLPSGSIAGVQLSLGAGCRI